jgi:hypothetical protein
MLNTPTRTGTSEETVFLSEDVVYGAVVAYMNGVGDGHKKKSRTDLDSRANTPVVGSGAHVLVDHNRTCEVSPFSPDYEPMEVTLVDTAVRYDRDGRVYILLIRNALFVPSLEYNLLPPLMMREAGVIVRDTPKIQLDDPSEEDHAITFPETGFRMPLSFWGVFSYFRTTKPTRSSLVATKPTKDDLVGLVVRKYEKTPQKDSGIRNPVSGKVIA